MSVAIGKSANLSSQIISLIGLVSYYRPQPKKGIVHEHRGFCTKGHANNIEQ